MSSGSFDATHNIWRGPPVAPLYNPTQSLGELLYRIMQRTPKRIAQISADGGSRTVTYERLHVWSVRFAQALIDSCGLSPGDLVTVVARNYEKLAAVVFGCFMAGIPVNTLDPSFRMDDFEHMLAMVRPLVIVCDSELVPVLQEASEKVTIKPQLVVIGKRLNGYPTVDDFLLPNGLETSFTPHHISDPAREVAIILCSSGTTGRSKGVCLSHSACISHACSLWKAKENDRVLCFSSLYWVSGLATLLTGTLAGTTRIITRETFNARLAIDLVEQYRITILFIPPAQGLAILADPTVGMADFSSLQMVLCGGGAVSEGLKLSFETYLSRGGKFVVGYGLSELGGGGVSTIQLYKPGAIGKLNPRIEAKVVDAEGNALGCDQDGELLLRTEFVFLEYFRNPDETAEMLDPDGWLHTGDIARYDTDGVFYVVDRKKDIIKYAGYQISPTELEETIMRMFGASLLMVCVTGIPVPGNDLPVALAIRQPGGTISEQEIVDALADVVADYKRLRGGLYFVDRLPMTPSGKVQRRRCREMAVELYSGAAIREE